MDAPLDYYERLLSDEAEVAVAASIDRVERMIEDNRKQQAWNRLIASQLRERFPNA